MRFCRIERRLWQILSSEFCLERVNSSIESFLQTGKLWDGWHCERLVKVDCGRCEWTPSGFISWVQTCVAGMLAGNQGPAWPSPLYLFGEGKTNLLSGRKLDPVSWKKTCAQRGGSIMRCNLQSTRRSTDIWIDKTWHYGLLWIVGPYKIPDVIHGIIQSLTITRVFSNRKKDEMKISMVPFFWNRILDGAIPYVEVCTCTNKGLQRSSHGLFDNPCPEFDANLMAPFLDLTSGLRVSGKSASFIHKSSTTCGASVAIFLCSKRHWESLILTSLQSPNCGAFDQLDLTWTSRMALLSLMQH